MQEYKLFMLLLGCTPRGRHTEQHDIFFGIGTSLKELLPAIKDFWPDAGTIHIDSWREVTVVDEYRIKIVTGRSSTSTDKLFFLNLGGYKPGDLEEYHYKILTVAKGKGEAVQQAKRTTFYLHTGFKGADSHIDDKYGADVDDIYQVEDILTAADKERFSILIQKDTEPTIADALNIGYLKLDKI
jgi:hypothetical protein